MYSYVRVRARSITHKCAHKRAQSPSGQGAVSHNLKTITAHRGEKGHAPESHERTEHAAGVTHGLQRGHVRKLDLRLRQLREQLSAAYVQKCSFEVSRNGTHTQTRFTVNLQSVGWEKGNRFLTSSLSFCHVKTFDISSDLEKPLLWAVMLPLCTPGATNMCHVFVAPGVHSSFICQS